MFRNIVAPVYGLNTNKKIYSNIRLPYSSLSWELGVSLEASSLYGSGLTRPKRRINPRPSVVMHITLDITQTNNASSLQVNRQHQTLRVLGPT